MQSDDRGLVEMIRALLASPQAHPALSENLHRNAAAAIERLLARQVKLEEALTAMVQRFELYAGPNDMHAGNHDLALLTRARQALEDKP